MDEYRAHLDRGEQVADVATEPRTNEYAANWHDFDHIDEPAECDTRVPLERIRALSEQLTALPRTPTGKVDLKIPAGTGSGRKLRLKGRGIPGKTPGDLYVIPQITVPPADSEAAQELYRKMERELPYNPRKRLGV